MRQVFVVSFFLLACGRHESKHQAAMQPTSLLTPQTAQVLSFNAWARLQNQTNCSPQYCLKGEIVFGEQGGDGLMKPFVIVRPASEPNAQGISWMEIWGLVISLDEHVIKVDPTWQYAVGIASRDQTPSIYVRMHVDPQAVFEFRYR